MIITRTPFRISYVGGGTDFKEFYSKTLYGGAVINVAINKYMYITVNRKFDDKIHVRYSTIEQVNSINELQHDIVRECLRLFNINHGIEIVIISDIPSRGTGLGSSGALAVGLIKALNSYTRSPMMSPFELAETAYKVEVEVLKAPIGKQDQYASSFGSLCRHMFRCDNNTSVHVLWDRYPTVTNIIQNSTLLYYTNNERKANDILQHHKENISTKEEILLSMVKDVEEFQTWMHTSTLKGEFYLQPIVNIINSAWEHKKVMTNNACTSSDLDSLVYAIRSIDSQIGVKLCGAGGGGFMMVVAPKNLHSKINEVMSNKAIKLDFNFEPSGSVVIYNDQIH